MKAFKDHKLQEEYIRESHLDYTIVRPSAFTNGPSTRAFKVDFNAQEKNLSLKIPREDIAYFMIEQLNSDKFIKRTVGISN